MKRTYLLFIIILIFMLSSSVLAGTEEAEYTDFSRYMRRLSEEEEEELYEFSEDARKKLRDLTGLFNSSESPDMFLYKPEFKFSVEEMNFVDDLEENILVINPVDRAQFEASYFEERENMELETGTSLNLSYQMGRNMLLEAGYDQETQQKLIGNDEFSSKDDENISEFEGVFDDYFLMEESSHKTNLGISYWTSDRLMFSAEYTAEDPFANILLGSTVLGLEYEDDKGGLRARYQIDQKEMERLMLTDLEIDLRDLATLSASYKQINPDEIADRIGKESTWDFGVDLSLTELSSFSIGYQMINNPDSEEDEEENDVDEGFLDMNSSIKAGLQIEF